jgi:hypothetical protein
VKPAKAARGADYDGPEEDHSCSLSKHRRTPTSGIVQPTASPFRDPTQDVSRREGPPKRSSPGGPLPAREWLGRGAAIKRKPFQSISTTGLSPKPYLLQRMPAPISLRELTISEWASLDASIQCH